MEKTGDFREGQSRSDFDMTKLGDLNALGEDSFYIASKNGKIDIVFDANPPHITVGNSKGIERVNFKE